MRNILKVYVFMLYLRYVGDWEMILYFIGWLILLLGLLDFILYYFMEMDLYHEVGINLPEMIWQYSAWILIGIGSYIIYSLSPEEDD